MGHALVNIAFEIAGLIAVVAIAGSVWARRHQIARALKHRQDQGRRL